MTTGTLRAYQGQAPVMAGGNTEYAARYGRELRKIVTLQARRLPRSTQRALGPSEIGHRCDRHVVGKMAGLRPTNNVNGPWAPLVGTWIHAGLEEIFRQENHYTRMARWIPEQKVRANILADNPGTADLYDAETKTLVDHKGAWVHTPVPTPSGWTAMEQLQPGDTVFGSDGRPCQVTRVYPVQYRDCYRITFDDGSALITDDVQELPFVLSRKRPQPALMSTAEAAGRIWTPDNRARPQRQLRLYNGGALELPPADLIVHPYVLGCWLGDGGIHGGTIGKPDDELFEHIRSCGYEVSKPHGERKARRTVYGLSGQLQVLGLQWRDPDHPDSHGRLTGAKRVPDEYLRGSYEQRLALLRGMMDTDGTWNRKRKQAVFTTTSKDLAGSVAELVATLGWKAKIFPQQATGFGLTVTTYHVAFTPQGANPFRLSRKADLVRLEGSRVCGYRIVQSIEPVLSVPTRCIDVDSPDHCYLAGEQMVPVHNCLGKTTLAKLIREGPPWHYFVQMIIYGQGFMDQFGLEVRRVILAAWPRTSHTLDDMYCWEWPWNQYEADKILRETAALTRARAEVAKMVLSRQIDISQVRRVPGDHCIHCPQWRPQSALDGAEGCPGKSGPEIAPGGMS